MGIIQKRLDETVRSKYNKAIAQDRKQQVGSGERGDKIRTYRFQDDRVQDHRNSKTVSVKKVMSGNIDLLWE
jgi:peptide chain release factor 1